MLHSEHPCDQCGRAFVDETALQLHKKRIHLATSVADYLRTDKTYTCDLCKKTFYYVVNLKKHHWLIHQRPKKPVEVVESIGPLDPSTIRLVSCAKVDFLMSYAGVGVSLIHSSL